MGRCNTLIEMSAERGGTTARNGQEHFDVLPADPPTASFDECVSRSADQIGHLKEDVRKHILGAPELGVCALLLLRPDRELGRDAIRSAGDAVALARTAKTQMREFVKRSNAVRLLLYYFGPLSGACFIGHQLNVVCRQIQIMEDQQPGYAPAFLLE
jgi:hypothetical protein